MIGRKCCGDKNSRLTPSARARTKVFEEQSIYLVSQAANDLNLTFVVEENQADRLVSMLHQLLITNQDPTEFMGPTWSELFEEKDARNLSHTLDRWWQAHQTELLGYAEQTPAYVYHLPTVRERAAGLRSVPSLATYFTR